MNDVCPLRITPEDYKKIQESEAVVITEWENSQGERWGELRFSGDMDECEVIADSSEIVIVPNGVTCIGNQVVKRDALLPIEGE